MPLLLTPAQPLATTAGLPVATAYAIINVFSYDRLKRRVDFTLGYYLDEAASLPTSGLAQLAINLPTDFSFQMQPAQAAQASDPQAIMEAYATQSLLGVLGANATIETVL